MEKHPMNTQTATRKMCVLQISLVLLSVLALPTMLIAQEKSPDTKRDRKALVYALQKGGYVIYLRHAATDHSRTDSDREDLNSCEKQRNLSEEGREQARTIGEAFTALGIKVAKVLTSPYCRCVDTGRLAFGEVTVEEGLNFAISKDAAETKRLATALRKLLGTQPPEGANIVLVSHSANLKEATGVWPKSEGVTHIFQPHEDGGFLHIGEVLAEEWVELVRSQ
jgi:phosphohistidine phosphatase SixA